MDSALAVHRLHFAFTVTFHYLFPQLTMGLALLIVILKTMALRTGDDRYNQAARFWVKIFAINFAMGVVTGIPMEFQFGTNWAQLLQGRRRRDRPDAGDGGRVFVLSGVHFSRPVCLRRKTLEPAHALVRGAAGVRWARGCRDSSSSPPTPGCSIPVGYQDRRRRRDPAASSFWGLILNPWTLWQYLHNMIARGGDRQLRDGGHRRVLSARRDGFRNMRASSCGSA